MKISYFPFTTETEGILTQFFSTIGERLMDRTCLLPAKGGFRYKRSQKKNKNYSDMPYWVHILNGLMGTFLFIEKDQKVLEVFKCNADYAKVFIISFAFHDANKLVKGKYKPLEEVVRTDLEKLLVEYEVKLFLSDYKEYMEDIKYLILNVEHGTTPHSFSKTSPSLPQPLLDKFKKYLNFADNISSGEIHSTQELYLYLQNLVEKKRLPKVQLQYIQIDKNIYKGLTTAVYNYLNYKLGGKIIYRLRDGFIYVDEKVKLNPMGVAKEIFEDELVEDDVAKIAKEEISSDNFQYIEFNFFQRRKVTPKLFDQLIDQFISDQGFKFFSHFKDADNKGDESYIKGYKGLTSILPKVEFNKVGKLFVSPDNYLSLSDEDKYLWRLLFMVRTAALSYLSNKELKNISKRLDVLEKKLENDHKYKKLISKGKKSILLHLIFLNHIISQNGDVKKSYENLRDKIIKIESCNFDKRLIDQEIITIGSFIKSFVNKDVSEVFLKENKVEKKRICTVCGQPSEVELQNKSQNTFALKPRNPSNKTVSSLANEKNYICGLCEMDNKLLRKVYPDKIRKKPDSVLFVEFFDYLFNINYRFLLEQLDRILTQKELTLHKKKELQHELDAKNMRLTVNDNFNIDDYFTFTYYNFGTDVKAQIYSLQKLLKLIKYAGLKVYISSVYTPYSQHDEMLSIDNAKNTLKNLNLSSLRMDKIDHALEKINFLFTIKHSRGKDMDIGGIIEISKNPQSIFWYSRKNNVNIGERYQLFINPLSMTNTKALTSILAKVNRLSANSKTHEETEIVRKSIEVLKNYLYKGYSLENGSQAISGVLYKKYKDKYNIEKYASEYGKAFINKIYKDDWSEKMPNPKELKYWIAQFAYLYRESSNEEWEVYNKKKGDKK